MSWSNSMSTSTRKKASNSLRRINSSQSSVRAMSPRVRHWYLRSSPGLNLMVRNDSTQPPCAYSDDTPPTKTRIIPPGRGGGGAPPPPPLFFFFFPPPPPPAPVWPVETETAL